MQLRVRTPTVADALPADLHPVLRRVYLNRGLGAASEYDLSLSRLLPFHSLKGVDAAVALLLDALDKQSRVLVVGDYDADGATSTALALSALRRFGLREVGYLVPDRFRYGYGLTPEIVQLAAARKPDLLITVDNGISSIAGVDAARSAGIKVLITDHHLPGAALPQAHAMVNSNQPGCAFPSKALAGVGVIFYLMSALRAKLRERGQEGFNLAELLDLVALGTVADVVPLDHNNRVLVQNGLSRIRAGRARPGINALLRVAGRDLGRVNSNDLGFSAGPRLNAAGRLEDMSLGIECLLSSDENSALALAQQLHELNTQRRELQTQMEDEALAQVANDLPSAGTAPPGLTVFDASWHEGVVGLVASRLKERYHRPVFAFAPNAADPAVLKGSGRSIPGFHIRDALDTIAARHPGLVSRFGGHAMAAGLSLVRHQLDTFTTAFAQEAERQLGSMPQSGIAEYDDEIAPEQLTLEVAEALERAGPWGQGFPAPRFYGEFRVRESRIVGERHLKMKLETDSGILDAIAFRETRVFAGGSRMRAIYALEINEYQGRRSAQLVVEEMDPA